MLQALPFFLFWWCSRRFCSDPNSATGPSSHRSVCSAFSAAWICCSGEVRRAASQRLDLPSTVWRFSYGGPFRWRWSSGCCGRSPITI